MLILSRKVGETIYIGDGIQVTVTGGVSGKIQLGITAPKNVKILREEVYLRDKRNENEAE